MPDAWCSSADRASDDGLLGVLAAGSARGSCATQTACAPPCAQCTIVRRRRVARQLAARHDQAKGPTAELACRLSCLHNESRPRASDIADAVLPCLQSASPLLAAGAIPPRLTAAEAGHLIETLDRREIHPLTECACLDVPMRKCIYAWFQPSRSRLCGRSGRIGRDAFRSAVASFSAIFRNPDQARENDRPRTGRIFGQGQTDRTPG